MPERLTKKPKLTPQQKESFHRLFAAQMFTSQMLDRGYTPAQITAITEAAKMLQAAGLDVSHIDIAQLVIQGNR